MKLNLQTKILFQGIIGLIIFAVILGLANFLKSYIHHPFYVFFVDTFNQAFWIIIILSVLFLISDILRASPFPFSLPYPIINALAFIYLVTLLFEIFPIIIQISGIELPWKLSFIKSTVVVVTFVLTIVVGYIHVFSHRHDAENKASQEETDQKKPNKKKK